MDEIRKVGVLGCGLMGSGIAQVCAQSGFETIVRDVSDEIVEKGLSGIGKRLLRLQEKEVISSSDREAAVGRLRGTTDLGDLASADIVIEAVIEDLPTKAQLLS